MGREKNQRMENEAIDRWNEVYDSQKHDRQKNQSDRKTGKSNNK